MGTRNVTAVVFEGKYVIAQYGQWDGYPEGQGDTARKFMREKFLRPLFLARLRETRWLTDDEIEEGYKEAGHKGGDWLTEAVSRKFNAKFPYLTRDHGAEILKLVQESTGPILLRNGIDFVRDSLMCEWAYVIDLDQDTFEVYTGFNTAPLPAGERFSDLPVLDRKLKDESQYYPVKHVITFTLDSLPNKAEFLAAIRKALPKEQDEDAA